VMSSLGGKKIALADYKSYLTGSRFVSFLFLDAIIMLVTIAGMLLLIVPGIYWAIISSFSYFIIASSDGHADVFKSITDSINMTVGKKWQIFGYQAIYLALILVSALHPLISLTVGVLATSLYWVVIGLIFKENL